MKTDLSGMTPAIPTAFLEGPNRWTKTINYEVQMKLIDHLLSNGANGIVVAGTTGAASVMSHDEHVAFAKKINEMYQGKTTIIAGSGSNCTAESIRLAQRIEAEAGIFSHLSVSPYYNKPNDEGMSEHYRAIADSIEGELILYSVPSRTSGKGILPYVAQRLAEHPRIIGIKEASGDLSRIEKTIKLTKGQDFAVISGEDPNTIDIIEMGGTGIISVAGNVVPDMLSRMVKYARNGGQKAAREIDRTLKDAGLYRALFPKHDDINPSNNPEMVMYALGRMGFDMGVAPLPLTAGLKEDQEYMDTVLTDLRLI